MRIVIVALGIIGGVTIQLPLWSPERSQRWRLYGLILVAYSLWFLVAAVASDLVNLDDAPYFFVPFAVTQLAMYGLRTEIRQALILGDPERRAEAGLPQYGGHSLRFWQVVLLLSPWHIGQYYRYVISDRASPLRRVRRSVPFVGDRTADGEVRSPE